MNQERLEGNWNELKGKVKQQWGKLTDDDLSKLEGRSDEIIGKIQKAYGKSKEDAEQEYTTWRQKHNF